MTHQIHNQARTTPKIRAELQASSLGPSALAKQYNISRQTAAKWKGRACVEDLPHTPHKLNTRLGEAQELVVVELRKLLFLSLDDLLVVTREFIDPKASRSAIGRLLERHGISNLAKLIRESSGEEPGKTKKKAFKDYHPGFLHVDIKYLPRMPDESAHRYLFVAIDRATRWAFIHLYDGQTEKNSVDFLEKVLENAPMKVEKILTDNGTQFTDRFNSKEKRPTGKHAFDQACGKAGIEHRLSPPRHPQTNGMAERFNGRISEVVRQTRFASATELETTLHEYVWLYNTHIPQRALNHLSPVQALREWQSSHPQLFIRDVNNHTGLDK
jgi:transposase InsO family protein